MRIHRLRFHLSIIAGVMGIIGILAISIVLMVLSVANQSAMTAAEKQFDRLGSLVRERTTSGFQPALDMAALLATVPGVRAAVSYDDDGVPAHPLIPTVLSSFRQRPNFYSVYIGLSDGTFIQIINTKGNAGVIRAHDAPAEAAYILRSITGEERERVQTWSFLSAEGRELDRRREPQPDYDPRLRPWYAGAIDCEGSSLSLPYEFNSLKMPGITASHSIKNQEGGIHGVLGIDLTISGLTEFVSGQDVTPGGGLALFADGEVLIAASPGFPMDAEVQQGLVNVGVAVRTIDDRLVSTEKWRISADRNLVLIVSAPVKDFMAGAEATRRRIIRTSVLVTIILIPFILLWALGLTRALKELALDAGRVSQMDFDGELKVKTPIYEFWQLGKAFGIMKETIAARTGELRESNEKLEMLVDMGIAMSAERDIDRLSESILKNAKELTNADGGSLYLVDKERTHLEFSIVLNDSLGFEQGGTGGGTITMDPVELYDELGKENHSNVVTHCFHTGKTLNIADAYNSEAYDFSGTKLFDSRNEYRSISFLTIPLKPRGGGKILGALQLINAQNPVSGEVITFPTRIQPFLEALGSASAVALQNWYLMQKQKNLFDELVRFVGSAIDGKSPYTARHCARVPEIAGFLIEEAEASDNGSLADFRFENADQRREFEIAAWLHDCGKVTTPEYIVDKATKLETIYNRIHEIRTRFEVVLRDARIRRHEAVLGGADPAEADTELRETEKGLHEDFAFVAECNIGVEFMKDDALERLQTIGRIEWIRFFDDRLGLSWAETRQLKEMGILESRVLPAQETILTDRKEHAIKRDEWTAERYKDYGFQLDVPELLYNRGELYNLSVRSGTLSEEDRFKINEHVAQTIIMLDQINFPEDLERVIEYAGSHHEHTDGSGYPRQSRTDMLSIPSKVLAIADIFEALTSSDRPYKQDKTLSETLDILHTMKINGQIDGDLFDLLLTSGAYMRYANIYLKPSQIDEVVIRRYL